MGRPPLCLICGKPIREEPVIITITGSSINGKKCHSKCFKDNENNLEFIEKQYSLSKKENRKKYNKTKKDKNLKEEKTDKIKKTPRKKKESNISKEYKQKMTEEEKKGLDDVYKYIQQLLNYDHPLSPTQVNKIQSLRFGNIVRKGTTIVGNEHGYPYPVILLTLKAQKDSINYALRNKNFNTENQKLSYILAIVANHINDVYERWKNTKAQEVFLNNLDTDDAYSTQGVEYKPKENKYLNNELFDDLW